VQKDRFVMNPRRTVWPALLAAFALLGCEQQPGSLGNGNFVAGTRTDLLSFSYAGLSGSPDVAGSPEFLALIADHQRYALSRFQADAEAEHNFLTAPFDAQQLLAMTSIGAAGATLEGITQAAALPAPDETGLALLGSWEQLVGGQPYLNRRSGLWGQAGYVFATDYLESQARWYGPAMAGQDFAGADAASAEAILQWLDGPLSYVADINPMTRLVLGRKSVLDAYWPGTLSSVEAFTGRFASLGKDQHYWVDMVRLTGPMNAAKGDGFQAVEVPLSGSTLSLLMIVPDEGGFADARRGFDRTFLQGLLPQLTPADMSVSIPVFVLSWSPTSPDLGDALREDAADFSGVNGQGHLYLREPQQRVELEVHGQGVRARTATLAIHEATPDEPESLAPSYPAGTVVNGGTNGVVSVRECFLPPDQRPFLFLLYDRQSGTVLHLGQIIELPGEPVPADWTVPSSEACDGTSEPVDPQPAGGGNTVVGGGFEAT
jgi:serpin B